MHTSSAAAFAAIIAGATSLDLDVTSQDSIRNAATTLAKGVYSYHNADSTAGQFEEPQPWYWWISGTAWTSLIDYSVFANDTTYQSDILSSLSQNLGTNYDFVPADQDGWEANDDQVYWVYNALTAMEYDFPALDCETSDNNTVGNCANSWHAIAVHAFDDFVVRWNLDDQTCGGGLKWQYNPEASGYTYKNSVSNGGFFQTAARLARYTGNETYADWATKIWDWTSSVGLIDGDYHVYDGSSDASGANCSSVDHDEWTYNIATFLHGAAHMYAYTNGGSTWETRVNGLVQAANSTFFGPFSNSTGVMYEQNCEKADVCSTDNTSFKASLSRWLGKTAALVPSARDSIVQLLEASAKGAASSCSGLDNSTCGIKWYIDGYDGTVSLGQQLSALEVVQSLLGIATAPKLAVLSS